MRRWYWILSLVVLASGCGGNGSTGDSTTTEASEGTVPSASQEGVIESGDGLASLSLPAGSLPEGVSLEDVQVHVALSETSKPGEPMMAVLLLPDGLVLTESAALTVDLPEALDGGFMAIHQSGDMIEFLDGDIEQDDHGFTFQASIGHFSQVSIYGYDVIFASSLLLVPEQVAKDQVQEAHVTITANDSFSYWVHFDSDGAGTARLLEFALLLPVEYHGNTVFWDVDLGSDWDPPIRSDLEVVETSTGWEAFASSTCVRLNSPSPFFASLATFNLTLLNRGEPQHSVFFEFAQALSGLPVQPPAASGPDDGGSELELLTLPVGSTFPAKNLFLTKGESVCTDSPVYEEPQAPPEFDPFKVVEATNVGNGVVEVTFAGSDIQSSSEDLFGFGVWIAVEKGPLRTSASHRIIFGETITSASLADQANEVDGVIKGIPGTLVTEWLAPNVLRFTITEIETPDSEVSVDVTVQQSEDSESFRLTYP